MSKMNSDEAFGATMQISNHPEYLKTVEKYNATTQMKFLAEEMQINNIAKMIRVGAKSEDNPIDINMVSFLSKSIILGKVDGGESTVKYVNSKITDRERISEFDIMMHRLKKIFPNHAEFFSEGLAPVEKNGKWGFIDKNGNVIISFLYDEVKSMNNGVAKVKLNGKWGFINSSGKEIVPCAYDEVTYFPSERHFPLSRACPFV